MAQVVMNAFDADVYIPEFKGLMQYGDQMGGDLRFSPNAINVETPGGVLQPSVLIDGVEVKLLTGYSGGDPVYLDPASIGTLMYLRDKYRTSGNVPYSVFAGESQVAQIGSVSRKKFSLDRNIYFIAAGGKVFYLSVAGDLKESGTYQMDVCSFYEQGDAPTTVNGTFRTDRWSWVTYEYTDNDVTRNILLLSNPYDGMYMIDPYKHGTAPGSQIVVDGFCLHRVSTPANFKWIERYADRIWGVGSGREEDDTIYYSRPFDATDWTQNNSSPEDGGGEIREPSWDKDRFISLKAFGDCLVAQTRKRAWKITGTDPTNFAIQEQYGNGCEFPDTIVNMGKYLMMLGKDSLVTYDGYSVTPFMKEATSEIFKTIGMDDDCKPFAVRVGDKYVLTLSNEIGDNLKKTYGQQFTAGNNPDDPLSISQTIVISGTSQNLTQKRKYYTLVYDMMDGTINVSEVPEVVSLCEQMPYMLTYTPASVNTPANNKLCPIRFDSWESQQVTPNAVKWVTPWITFGRTDIKKGGFDVEFTAELRKKKVFVSQWWPETNVRGGDVPSKVLYTEQSGNVKLKFTVQTEKKSKTKEYTVTALTDTEIAEGKEYKMKKLHFGGSGRRFRLIIESEAGNTIPWRLIGGIHIIAEMDKD